MRSRQCRRWPTSGSDPMPADRVGRIYLRQIDLVEDNLLRLAEAMPAELYGFRPDSGASGTARTFGDQVKHAATMIYMTAALVLEERSPYGPGRGDNGPDDVQGKEAIVGYLKASLAYARRAAESITEGNHLDPLRTWFREQPRIEVMSGLTFHSYDHYGQLAVYARLNGIVPPASVR